MKFVFGKTTFKIIINQTSPVVYQTFYEVSGLQGYIGSAGPWDLFSVPTFFHRKPKIMPVVKILVDPNVLITMIFRFLKSDQNCQLNLVIWSIFYTFRAKTWPNIIFSDNIFY